MRLITIKSKNGDIWSTIHKGKKEDDEAEFVAAFMNGDLMQEEGMEETEGSGKKKIIMCDKKKMKEDFDNHPGDGVRGGERGQSGEVHETLIERKLYCLPQRNAMGQIVGYNCYGSGPYTCG